MEPTPEKPQSRKGKGRKLNSPSSPTPKNPDGTNDKDKVRALFMASPHVEWAPFAQSMNWDTYSTYSKFPTTIWTKEKKDILAKKQAEEISEMLFNHRSRWHKDVLKTLNTYPQAADAMLGILQAKMNEYIEMINSDIEDAKASAKSASDLSKTLGIPAEKETPKRRFVKVKPGELMNLAIALRTVTETKHRSLLINDWSVKVAEQFSTPEGVLDADEKGKETREWQFELIGGEKINRHDLENMMHQWFDPPQKALSPPNLELNPEPEAVEESLNSDGNN